MVAAVSGSIGTFERHERHDVTHNNQSSPVQVSTAPVGPPTEQDHGHHLAQPDLRARRLGEGRARLCGKVAGPSLQPRDVGGLVEKRRVAPGARFHGKEPDTGRSFDKPSNSRLTYSCSSRVSPRVPLVCLVSTLATNRCNSTTTTACLGENRCTAGL